MKYVAICLLLFTAFILSATLAVSADTITGTVMAVADGDTITVLDAQLEQRKIRLNGIDAPETNQDFGQAAKQKLSDLVFGKNVAVVWSKTDRYDRILGTVTVGSADAGLEQIKAGMAWYFRRYESDVPEIERRLYAAAEAEARIRKLGLWSQSSPMAPWDWRGRTESLAVDPQPATPTTPAMLSYPPAPASARRDKSRSTTSSSRRSYSVQCSATTKRGSRCSRMTLSSNGRCWQHGGN